MSGTRYTGNPKPPVRRGKQTGGVNAISVDRRIMRRWQINLA
jgi:hypothetical protein